MSKTKVYLITDSEAIDYLINDDFEAFKSYISSEEGIDISEPLEFDTEAEAMAYCAGLGYGEDERATPSVYPLRSCEPCDLPYIVVIERIMDS